MAGFCNATVGTGPNDIKGPRGIYVSLSDGTLYMTDFDLGRFQAFSPFSRTGHTLWSGGVHPIDIFVDSSDTIYMVDEGYNGGTVLIQQGGSILRTLPSTGISSNACVLTELYKAYGIAVDRSGNIYIALDWCYAVVKWAPNATSGTIVAGQLGTSGSSSNTLNYVRFIHLDEDRNALYVTDSINHRIQKFIIGGNGTGMTVAGNTISGIGMNELNNPAGIWVTRDGQTLYIADYGNHRVMKWMIDASQGSVVAGSVSGMAGSTNQLLNGPGGVTLDPSETYLYVADYNNHRIQLFRL